uniref:Transcription factor TFIIB cyclin-like domain-containing protein n=1 Tax=viral metagenome TaxID=1070528 RepID=A0A6C0KR36_9ZZZZ
MESLFNLRTLPSVKESFESWEEEKVSMPVDLDTCPHCFNTDCLYTTDLVTCRECGYIVSRPFDNTAEYRYFSQEDRGGDPTRVGAPQDPRLPEASMGTVILNGYGTAKTMYRVRKYHSWNTVPYKERSFIQTCERLSLIGLNSGINQSIIEDSKNLYTTLQDIGGRQGLSRDALLSACLYMSLKQASSPRKPKEIADLFGLTSSTFTKALKQMQEVMALARQKGVLRPTTSNKPSQASTQAIEYIQLPLSRLPLPRSQMEHLFTLCKRIAEKADEIGLSQENMPPSLAAGCVAFVIKRCDTLNLPLSKIAKASEISVATLQKCLRRLESYSDALEAVL